MASGKKDTPAENETTRITAQYAKNFEAKVMALQAHFTGKHRRALYEALKAKGVITEDYSTEMWDNDFKAWRKNPNNGIFRHLEMAGAILEEAQMPASQVFGGPHAKDTDEVVKGISAGVIAYLESSLEGFKTYRKNAYRASIKRERITNGKAFKKMVEIYFLIEKYFGPWETHLIDVEYIHILRSSWKGLNKERTYAPFFFLFAWSNLTDSKTDILNGCIYTLCNKILNNNFAPYYYAYFSQNFSTKRFLYQNDRLTAGYETFLDIILNQALVIAYQLNAIIQVYRLYVNRRTITITEKREKNHFDLTYVEQSTGEEKIDTDTAPIYPISSIDVRINRYLKTGIPEGISNGIELKKAFNRKLKETNSLFCDFVEILENSELKKAYYPFGKHRGLPLEILEKLNVIINNLQKAACILNNPGIDDIKTFREFYVVTEKRKEPIKIRKEYYTLAISNSMVNLFDSILSSLKDSMEKISSQISTDQVVGNKDKISPPMPPLKEFTPNKNQSDNISQKPQEETLKN